MPELPPRDASVGFWTKKLSQTAKECTLFIRWLLACCWTLLDTAFIFTEGYNIMRCEIPISPGLYQIIILVEREMNRKFLLLNKI